MVIRQRFSFQGIRDVLGGLLEQDLHAKRVDALCNATLGVMHSASLAVCTIGQRPRRRPQPEAQTRGEAGGCHWQYQADIVYASGKSHIPTETSTGSNSPVTLMTHASYEAQLWNDREYVAGQNGETAPIGTQDHNDFRYEGGVILGCTSSPCDHLIITAAPGESFRYSLTPSDPLTGYDPSKGIQAAVLPSARDVQLRQPKHHRHPASAKRSLRCWYMVEFLRRS